MSIGLYYGNKKVSGSSDMKFEDWKDGVEYKTGNVIVYNEKLYRCLLDHTSSTKFEDDEKLGCWKLIVGNKKYEEKIITPSKTWNIQHNLNCLHPIVQIFDNTTGDEMELDIQYYSENLLILSCDVEVTGTVIVTKI